MFIDLHKTLERIRENLPADRRVTFEMLEKAYEQTLWLRSHILGVMYDMIDFGSASKRTIGEVSASQTDSDNMVCLVIPEPLPGLKELTGTLEEHWTRLIHEAIAKQASLDAAEKEAKRQQPYIDMARLVYERVGIARDRNRVSVESLYKAQKRFYSWSVDDKRQKDYERGVGTFSDNTDLPFGYSVRASLLITIRDVADVLGCSVDYLLGRTNQKTPYPKR